MTPRAPMLASVMQGDDSAWSAWIPFGSGQDWMLFECGILLGRGKLDGGTIEKEMRMVVHEDGQLTVEIRYKLD